MQRRRGAAAPPTTAGDATALVRQMRRTVTDTKRRCGVGVIICTCERLQ